MEREADVRAFRRSERRNRCVVTAMPPKAPLPESLDAIASDHERAVHAAVFFPGSMLLVAANLWTTALDPESPLAIRLWSLWPLALWGLCSIRRGATPRRPVERMRHGDLRRALYAPVSTNRDLRRLEAAVDGARRRSLGHAVLWAACSWMAIVLWVGATGCSPLPTWPLLLVPTWAMAIVPSLAETWGAFPRALARQKELLARRLDARVQAGSVTARELLPELHRATERLGAILAGIEPPRMDLAVAVDVAARELRSLGEELETLDLALRGDTVRSAGRGARERLLAERDRLVEALRRHHRTLANLEVDVLLLRRSRGHALGLEALESEAAMLRELSGELPDGA